MTLQFPLRYHETFEAKKIYNFPCSPYSFATYINRYLITHKEQQETVIADSIKFDSFVKNFDSLNYLG